jgi:hypothetical protein
MGRSGVEDLAPLSTILLVATHEFGGALSMTFPAIDSHNERETLIDAQRHGPALKVFQFPPMERSDATHDSKTDLNIADRGDHNMEASQELDQQVGKSVTTGHCSSVHCPWI